MGEGEMGRGWEGEESERGWEEERGRRAGRSGER